MRLARHFECLHHLTAASTTPPHPPPRYFTLQAPWYGAQPLVRRGIPRSHYFQSRHHLGAIRSRPDRSAAATGITFQKRRKTWSRGAACRLSL
jgi:hypothetical protein